ncbi:MAG: insulinase family protein [Propionibacteriaceae bacterium]|nr:insulinase family protein [Propionibacteriaceae bacterium]
MRPRPLDYRLHRYQLANGLRLVVNPDPWTPAVAVSLCYDVGSAHETAGRTGFAHLFEHLMFSGSAQVASGEHLSQLQALGGEANATTSFDRTVYFETVPVGVLPLALWLEADRLGSLLAAVDQVALDTQREVVKEEKRQRNDNVPYGDAFAQLVELAFGSDHPYGHLPIGSMADLDQASLRDIHDFFRAHYRPNNLVLSLSGAIGFEEAVELVETYFGELPSPPAQPRLSLSPLPPLSGRPRRELSAVVPLDAVYCCWRVPPLGLPAHDAVGLGLSVLADGLSARLHQRLVRTDLADASGAWDLGLSRGNSLVVAYATARSGVDPARLEEALLRAWGQFVADGPSPDELGRAVAHTTRDWLTALSSLGSRADALSESSWVYGAPDNVNTWLTEIASIAEAQVWAACRDWLAPQQCGVLTYRKAVA